MESAVLFFAFIYVAVLCAVLFLVFFKRVSQKKWDNRYLHICLLAFVPHVVYKLIGLVTGNLLWLELPFPTGLLYPALLFLLAYRFYQPDKRIPAGQKALLFIPFFVFTVFFGIAVQTEATTSWQLLYLKSYYISLILSMLTYAVRIISLYQRYDSTYHALDLLLKQLTMMCLGLAIFGYLRYYEIVYADKDFGFEVQPLVYLFLLLGLGLILRYHFVGRLEDIRNGQSIHQLMAGDDETRQIHKTLSSYLTSGEAEQYAAVVERELIANQLFLNPSLSLDVLVQQTAIPRHQLSQLFNSYFGKTFYQFIAEQRIAYAMERIVELGDTVTLDSLSYECGFNSKTSFNRYFKAQTGMTPSEFRAYHLSENLPNFHIAAG